MQQVSLVGRVVKTPENFRHKGVDQYFFVLRAENSPSDDRSSAFDFNVTSTNMPMRDKLRLGSAVFVGGLQKIEPVRQGTNQRVRVTIKALFILVLDVYLSSRATLDVRHFAGSIPLDFAPPATVKEGKGNTTSENENKDKNTTNLQ